MKVALMHPERDFDKAQRLPDNADDLSRDLNLGILVDAMAAGDPFLAEVARQALLCSLHDADAIRYRQDVLSDCLRKPLVIRDLYAITVDAIHREDKNFLGLMSQSADLILQRSVDVLQMFADILASLRRIALAHAAEFRSAGFTNLFQMLAAEFDEDYLDALRGHLRQLRFREGVLISARLGPAGKGTDYVLRHPHARPGWLHRPPFNGRETYSYRIADGDDTGARALAELADLGLNRVASVLVQANDRILGFIKMLRYELGFYIGCLNLKDRLAGEPICLPTPVQGRCQRLSCRGLYDTGLRLIAPSEQMVGNDLNADAMSLILLTGANQGGKSTFLRAVGLAHLMMQCGMFVPAESMQATICSGVFTHFRREEDATMNRGKLDDELARMSAIADLVTSGGLVLFNESFAATNEREGSQIARQIVRALIDRQVKVVFVTHHFDLAHALYTAQLDNALFLRADRRPDARRTFKLLPGEPLPTSYGQDIYQRIFEPLAQPIPSRPHLQG